MNGTSTSSAGGYRQTSGLAEWQRHAIVQLVDALYHKATMHFGCSAQPCAVEFDLRGKAAGQWRLRRGMESLHFNERLFAIDPRAHMPDTVAHEVAHSVVYRCHGMHRQIRPHGKEWRSVMERLGFSPHVTYTASPGTLVLALNHHLYRCACRDHALGPNQHRRVRRGERRYHCRLCGTHLVQAEPGRK